MSTIGELVNRLAIEDPQLVLSTGWMYAHSYRGYYHELGVERAENVTVKDCLATLRDAIGQTFSGWKGGDYTMYDHSTVYLVDREGNTGDEMSTDWLDAIIELSKSRRASPQTRGAWREYDVKRHTMNMSSGCLGGAAYYEADEPNVGHYGVNLEEIAGRALAAGARVRVTVEVLEDPPLPTTCQNPWPHHRTLKQHTLPHPDDTAAQAAVRVKSMIGDLR